MGGTMRSRYRDTASRLIICVTLSLAASIAEGEAAENSAVGVGNALANDTSGRSPLVLSAKNYILARAGEIRDDKLRGATRDAINRTSRHWSPRTRRCPRKSNR